MNKKLMTGIVIVLGVILISSIALANNDEEHSRASNSVFMDKDYTIPALATNHRIEITSNDLNIDGTRYMFIYNIVMDDRAEGDINILNQFIDAETGNIVIRASNSATSSRTITLRISVVGF